MLVPASHPACAAPRLAVAGSSHTPSYLIILSSFVFLVSPLLTEKGLSPPQAAGFQPWRLGVCGLSPFPLLLLFRSISLHIFPQRHQDFTGKGTGIAPPLTEDTRIA